MLKVSVLLSPDLLLPRRVESGDPFVQDLVSCIFWVILLRFQQVKNLDIKEDDWELVWKCERTNNSVCLIEIQVPEGELLLIDGLLVAEAAIEVSQYLDRVWAYRWEIQAILTRLKGTA